MIEALLQSFLSEKIFLEISIARNPKENTKMFKNWTTWNASCYSSFYISDLFVVSKKKV